MNAEPLAGHLGTILHVAEAYGGGVAQAIKSFTLHASSFDHVLLYHDRGFGEVDIEPFRETVPMTLHHWSRIDQVRKVATRVGADVVHLHSSFAGLYGRARRLELPVVYSPHCYGFEREDIVKILRLAVWHTERALANRSDAVAACSKREAHLTERLGQSKVTFIPNVPPLDHLYVPRQQTVSKPTVMFVGRLSPQKDPLFALNLISEHRRMSRAQGIEYVWVGDGDAEVRRKLESLGIVVTGWLQPKEVAALLSEASVYVHTALWEGFPLTVVEAAALGVPLLLRDIASLRGLGFDRLLRSPIEMAEGLELLLYSKEARAHNLKAARRALSLNTEQHASRGLNDVYTGLIEGVR